MTPFCEHCGNKLDDSEKNCPKCGKPVETKKIAPRIISTPHPPPIINYPPPPSPQAPYLYQRNPQDLIERLKLLLIFQIISIIALVGFLFLGDIYYGEILGVEFIVMSFGTFAIIVVLALANFILTLLVGITFNTLYKLLRRKP